MEGAHAFGQWLKQRRKSLDITQEQLAERIGCSMVMVMKIEAGERRPSRQMAELIAENLAIPTEDRLAFIHFARAERTGHGVQLPSPSSVGPRTSLSSGHEPDVTQQAVSRPSATLLPFPLTALIGRDREIAHVKEQLLNSKVRLVTLAGPPGIGKTRLALQAAAQAAPAFPDGAYFVDLSPVTDPDLVPATIARALRLQEAGGQPMLELLRNYLREKNLLLVLDNFEQVMPAAMQVVDLLTTCMALKVMVTSREALNVRGERRFTVPPLDLPDLSHLPPPEHLVACSSIALFVERAGDANPDFTLTADNAGLVAAICSRLDGIPLAIELVAARTNLFAPSVLLDKLDNRLSLLTGGPRDLPARHRTLRNSIAWSYDLLGKEEQTLFTRLGVFAGGCTLPALEAVCNAHGDFPVHVLELVASLLDKNLLQQDRRPEATPAGPGKSRLIMLDTIREFAYEQLEASGEIASLRRLHAEYYLSLVKAAVPELQGPQQVAWFERLDWEHDNLTAAIHWTLENDEIALGLGMAASLERFWQIRGYHTEGRGWLDRLLAAGDGQPTVERAMALQAAGKLTLFQNDQQRTREYFLECLEIYHKLDDPWGVTVALHGLGNAALDEGNYDDARPFYEEALAIRRKLDNKHGLAGTLNNLALLAIREARCEEAQRLLEEGLALIRQTGDQERIGLLLGNLGRVALREGRFVQALAPITESLLLLREVNYRWGIAYCLFELGEAASGLGDPERAARLLGAADSLIETIGARMDPIDRASFEGCVFATRMQMRGDAFRRAWQLGRSRPPEETVEYALEGAARASASAKVSGGLFSRSNTV